MDAIVSPALPHEISRRRQMAVGWQWLTARRSNASHVSRQSRASDSSFICNIKGRKRADHAAQVVCLYEYEYAESAWSTEFSPSDGRVTVDRAGQTLLSILLVSRVWKIVRLTRSVGSADHADQIIYYRYQQIRRGQPFVCRRQHKSMRLFC